jgi:hypothetical protein
VKRSLEHALHPGLRAAAALIIGLSRHKGTQSALSTYL